ncbi:Periplasmic component of the Tol biopolymer transport system [Planctomycetales bacterium 10988]|nr:Periplasmic component of the Tol biopolymer transport system [Planctomycetales bacterium 10988]
MKDRDSRNLSKRKMHFWYFPLLVCIAFYFAVNVSPEAAQRKLLPGQVARLMTIGIDGTEPQIVYETTDLIEAPNWTPDGKWLVFNSKGLLWKIPADGSGSPVLINTGKISKANNDHVLSPDGKTIYFSAKGHLYSVPITGGEPFKISNDHDPEKNFRYFLHGVSPDNQLLAYVGAEKTGKENWGRLDLYTIPVDGGKDVRLTDTAAPDDGPEWSPDGAWIYFNSELNAKIEGHSQVYRMRPDGSEIEQLTHDERVNWFPHVSPAGDWVVYLSYPPGTLKHPANKDVILRRMRLDGSEQADVIAFFGGQGTINVTSWAPDSKRFAFVAYPLLEE